MVTIVTGDNEIDGMGIVELVDLVSAVDHRHLPAEQVDEEPLAVSEHGFEKGAVLRRQMVVDDVNHGMLPVT